MTAQHLAYVLARCAFRFSDEKDLQAGIAEAFTSQSIPFEREVRLDVGDIVDFMVGTTAVEVKIKGSLASVTRQLHRYAQHDRVKELVLVTSLLRLGNQPDTMNGKPLRVLPIMGAFR